MCHLNAMLSTVVKIFFLISFYVNYTTQMDAVKVKILHTNDMFSKVHEVKLDGRTCNSTHELCYGGFARVYEYVRTVKLNKSLGTDTIFLNAGNTCGGNIYFYVHKKKIIYDLLNRLNISAGILGPNDFELVPDLSNFLNYSIVISNFDRKDYPKIKKHDIIYIEKNYKIGILGYSRSIPFSTRENIKFKNEIESLNYESMILIAKGVKTIIAIGNTNLENHLEIAKQCPFIDVIIGGYGNFESNDERIRDKIKLYPISVLNHYGKYVYIFNAGKHTLYIGDFDLYIDVHSGRIISHNAVKVLLDYSYKKSQYILDILRDKYDKDVENHRAQTSGTTFIKISNENYICKKRECNLGNAFADHILKYYVSHVYNFRNENWTDAAMVILSGGAFGFSIDQGDTYNIETILDAYPALDKMISVSLLGKYIYKVLNHAVAERQFDYYPNLLQFGGIRAKFDVRKSIRFRVCEASALCANCTVPYFEPIVKSIYYKVLVSSNLYFGSLGYTWFMENGFNVKPVSEKPIYRLVVEAIENKELYSEVDGRLIILEENLAPKVTINLVLLFMTAIKTLFSQ